eukprot:gnl/MRDRNA2_/MRDRNA2_58572_c0_seq1.p1 gnl/MRDRNA2_/MRDRNA2_58572_c0~~gnl/MRDRNA2_/MRDRNA2_58572_c0_seq1.p1  ORF type:complete len:774 (+),score=183.45 gnl/MRDRNA2_/MRDRNA2_58572_c0_seq1:52-2322(+)
MEDPSEPAIESPKTEADEVSGIMFDVSSGMQTTGLQFPPGLELGTPPASLDFAGSPPLGPDAVSAPCDSMGNPDDEQGLEEAARYPLKVLLAARLPGNDTIPLSHSMPKCVAIPRVGPAPVVKGGGKGGQKHPFGKEKVSEYITIDEAVLAASGPDALRRDLRQIGSRTGAFLRVESGLNGKYVTVVGHLEQVKKALELTKLLLEQEAAKAPETCDTVEAHASVGTPVGNPESGEDVKADGPPALMSEVINVDTAQDQFHDEAQQNGIDSDVDFVDCLHESEQKPVDCLHASEQRSVSLIQEALIEDKTASDLSQPCCLQSADQSGNMNSDLDFSECTEELEHKSSPPMEEASTNLSEATNVQTYLPRNAQCQSELTQFVADAESDVDVTDWEIPEHWKRGGVQVREVEQNNGEFNEVLEASFPKPSIKNHKPIGVETKKVVILSPPDSDQESAPQDSTVKAAHEQHVDSSDIPDVVEKQVCGALNRRPPPPPLPREEQTSEVAQPRKKKSHTKAEKQNQKTSAQMILVNVPSPSRSILPVSASSEQVFEDKNSFGHLASESDMSDNEKTKKAGGGNRKGKQPKIKDSSMVSGTKRPSGNLATANAAAPRKVQSHYVETLNPLPQRSRARIAAFIPAERVVINSANAATSEKWKERPVEKVLVGMRYEEEEDPELAKYIWNPRTQKPLVSQGRPQPKARAATRPAGSMPTTNSQRQNDGMVKQVVEMGFDVASAQRALAATKWVSVDAALNALFDQ